MKQQVQLKIAEPCHENWNNMHPTQQGRFCMSCRKEVVDFSTLTDKEILDHIAAASSGICGRAGNDQLNRVLSAPPEPRGNWWKYWMGIAASLVMLSAKSNGQTTVLGDTILTHVAPPDPKMMVGKIAAAPSADGRNKERSIVVSGVITDEKGMPVPYAAVMVKDTRKGVVSNDKGFFIIKIDNAENTVLRISSVGFEMQDIKIGRHEATYFVQQNVSLKSYSTMGLVVVGEVTVTRKRKKNWIGFLKKDSVKREAVVARQSISIYPNPVNQGATIKLTASNLPQGNYRMAVYNAMGNPVEFKEIKITSVAETITISCDQRFQTGVYIFNITGNGRILSTKCIVQ